MGIKSFLKNELFKYKTACSQVKKNKRTNSKIKILLEAFAVKKYNCISGKDLTRLFSKIHYPKQTGRFFYFIDEKVAFANKGLIIGNIPIDYSVALSKSLEELRNSYNSDTIDIIINSINNIVRKNKEEKFSKYLIDFKNKESTHFEESLQRILLVNQLLWQTNHTLVGLGRLDYILSPILESDLANGFISFEEAYLAVKDFLTCLHRHYKYKSNTLLGDTGQIIVLGGKQLAGQYFCSQLTYMFVDAIAELKLPDPKILVRCSDNMPIGLMKKSLLCISTGIGSPLLSNDNVIIPGLINNNYCEDDAYNYGTSACWEPLIPGKSTDQNNVFSFILSESVSRFVDSSLEHSIVFSTFEDFMASFRLFVIEDLKRSVIKADLIEFEKDPIQSLFLHNSFEDKSDLSDGSVVYNSFGILNPGFSNGINSLINIKRLVFEKHVFSLSEFNEARKNNFIDKDYSELSNTGEMFGEDSNEVIALVNQIVACLDEFCDNNKNKYGHNYKFGLSSPSYITSSHRSPASFDGRRNGDPFGVHISSNKQLPLTELVNFGARIDYSNHNIDGNVIDAIVSPRFIEMNIDKLTNFMMLSVSNGFFEIQINVLSSKVLRDALLHPESHKDLIVRVWGFSAYFNDLPKEYKMLLIKRAEINEGISR